MSLFRRSSRSLFLLFIVLFLCAWGESALGQTVFDLAGPRIDMRVQRGDKTLPISSVPNLQAGDRLWLHPDLPESQSARYLMIVVFLRGATNPPPERWFTLVETWTRAVKEEGVFVTVPEEAQQGVVFLAPETGGGFSALRKAVRGKPGAFVRAVQDLELASLERARIEKYLAAVRESTSTPEELKDRSVLLARSLNLKLDQACFDKPTAEQVTCLTQHTDHMVLDDANMQSMVTTLTSGDTGHLLSEITSTPKMGGGAYSPYIGAVVDVARILGNAHTAHYQYIPALALPKGEAMNLRLNSPPSFRNPKSVLVIGLPHVGPAVLPRLRPVDARRVFCIEDPALTLQAEGAPLVFATELAHDFVLHVESKSGSFDLPAKTDPANGGFVVDTSSIGTKKLDRDMMGTVRGMWGFQPFEGPRFKLHSSQSSNWVVASRDASALIVGRDDTLHLQSGNACCVKDVTVRDKEDRRIETKWKITKADELEVQVALKDAKPGPLTLTIASHGRSGEGDEIVLQSYAEAGRLDGFTIYAGDAEGVLTGTRLDEVAGLELKGVRFVPGQLSRAHQQDELRMAAAKEAAPTAMLAGESAPAKVTLKDGRVLNVNVTVEQPRPTADLMSKSVELAHGESAPAIKLMGQDDLPQNGRLTFVMKSRSPETFPPREKIEVATADESFHVLLSVADGNLTLQDAKTVVGVLDPMKHLGPSAFGALKFRAVSETGVAGAWQPLAMLVRLPVLKEVRCSRGSQKGGTQKECSVAGDKLYLLDSVSTDAEFSDSVRIPDGFIARTLEIPATKNGTLYLRLRDNPASTATAVVPVRESRETSDKEAQ